MAPSVVALPPGSPRGGVITQAAVLKVTANGTNTSPVIRGVWVNDRILGTPPSPPPPGIPAVEPDIRGATTIRQQLERHRSDAACAACHAQIDPPGMALESFAPVGRYRTRYRVLKPDLADVKPYDRRVRYRLGLAVDPADRLSGGEAFAGIASLKSIYARDPKRIARTMTEHLIVYATGSTSQFVDRQQVDRIVRLTAKRRYGLRSLIHGVVQSPVFRQH